MSKAFKIARTMNSVLKEKRTNPQGLYFRLLGDLLNTYYHYGLDKKEVITFVEKWVKENDS